MSTFRVFFNSHEVRCPVHQDVTAGKFSIDDRGNLIFWQLSFPDTTYPPVAAYRSTCWASVADITPKPEVAK